MHSAQHRPACNRSVACNLAALLLCALLALVAPSAVAAPPRPPPPPPPAASEPPPPAVDAQTHSHQFTAHRRGGFGGSRGRSVSRPTPTPVARPTPTPVARPTPRPAPRTPSGIPTTRGGARGLGPLLFTLPLARPRGRGRFFRNEGFEGDDDDCDYIVYVDYRAADAPAAPQGQRRFRCVDDDDLFFEGEYEEGGEYVEVSAAHEEDADSCGAAIIAATVATAAAAIMF